MKQLKTGIIGMGIQGCKYSEIIAGGQVPQMKLAAVAARRDSQKEWVQEHLASDVQIFSEGKELIDSGVCEAVIITVPHYFHPELAIYAMERGIHVLCDKPAGVYTKQVREMNEAAGKVLNGTPQVAEGVEGIKSLMISNAMYLSSWLGETVELPVDEDLFLRILYRKNADFEHISGSK